MRARDLILIPATIGVTVFGLLWGGHSTYVSVRNRAPIELTCAEYLQRRPDAEWLRLTHCTPDLDHIGLESSTHTPKNGGGYSYTTGVYVPLRPEGAAASTPSQIVLVADHGPLMALESRYAAEATQGWLATFFARPIEGVVETGLKRSERRKAELRDLKLRLADDFVVIEQGEQPEPLGLALGGLGLGLGGLALLVRRVRRRRRNARAPLAKATLVS